MIKKIAESITDWTTKYSPLEGALEEKVICYGLEIFLDNVLAMATFILIGIFVGRGVETFLCLLGFGILRTQAGGFHCETKWKCRLWMLMMLSISIGVSEMVVFSIALRTCFFGLIEVAVLILAPVEGKKNKITDEEVQKRKKKRAAVIVFFCYFFTFFLENQTATAITMALLFETYTLIPEERKWKR